MINYSIYSERIQAPDDVTSLEMWNDIYELTLGAPTYAYLCISVFSEQAGGDGGTHRCFEVARWQDAYEYAVSRKDDTTCGVYLRQTLLSTKPQAGRGKKEDTAGTNRITADLDLYKKGKAKDQAVKYLIEEFQPKPNVILDSGGGLQVKWYLADFCSDTSRIEGIGQALQHKLDDLGADHTFDVTRVLRLPGTFNNKIINGQNLHRPTSILYHQINDVYNIDDLPQEIPETTFEYEFGEPEVIEETALLAQCARATDGILRDRIFSEKSAHERGAEKDAAGSGICRYKNDLYIVRGLLALGFSAEVCRSVLTHPTWFSGAKFRAHHNDYVYVENTIRFALAERSPESKAAHFVSATDLMSRIGEIEWTWYKWIPKGLLTMILAPQDRGKSYFTLGLVSVMIEGGRTWPDGTTYEGDLKKCLWIETEESYSVNLERITKNNLNADNIKFYFPDGEEGFTTNLLDPKVQSLIETEVARGEYCVVVVDALLGAHKENENDSKAGQVCRWLAHLARIANLPVLVTHHTNKGNPQDPDAMLRIDRSRGSSALMQYARSAIGLNIPENESDGTIDILKMNLAARAEPIAIHLSDELPTFSPIEVVEATRVDPLKNVKNTILTLLEDGKKHAAGPIKKLLEADGTSMSKIAKAYKELVAFNLTMESKLEYSPDGTRAWYWQRVPETTIEKDEQGNVLSIKLHSNGVERPARR